MDQDHTKNIPPEVLVCIFQHLPAQELTTRVENVCRRWQEVVRSPYVWSKVEYEPLHDEPLDTILETVSRHPHLKMISLSEVRFSVSLLSDSISLCKELKNLKIANNRKDLEAVTFFEKIASNCLNITYLEVPHWFLSDNECVKQIARLNNLKSLYMKLPESSFNCLDLSLTSLKPLVNGCPQLECVDVNVGNDLSDFKNFILKKMAQLKIIRICFVSNGNYILRLLSTCTKLEVLRLAGYAFFPQEEILSFPPMPNLRKLHFGVPYNGGCPCRIFLGGFVLPGKCCYNVNFSSVIGNCREVQVLDVLCGLVKDDVMNINSMVFLNRLRLSDVELSEDSIRQIGRCTHLKYLELRSIKWIGQGSIGLLVTFCCLETLIFDGCDVTNFPYSNLQSKLEKLRLLIFAACLGVNWDEIRRLRNLMPYLKIQLHMVHKVAPPM